MFTGLIAFEVVAKINNIDVDLRSISREYGLSGDEIPKEELLRIIKNLKFKVKLKQMSLDTIQKYPIPCIFLLKDGSYGVLLKVNWRDGKALIFLPTEKNTQDITFRRFKEIATDEFIFLSHKMITSRIKFGFKWFYAEIIKYKQVMVEVLLGSFVVQLFGLVTPLFTQVILDKVIVHRSMTTLDVLAIAFIAVTVFEFILNINPLHL